MNSKWEGFGNVLVEALFYKLPIISTNCLYGPNEILKKGKYGKLIELNDIDKLKDAILNYNYDKDDKEERFNRSLDYSVQIISKEYISFFFNN